MKTFKLLALVFTPIVVCSVACAQSGVPKTDNQEWNDFQLTIPVTQKLDLTIPGKLRFGGNITMFVDEYVGIGLNYRIQRHVTLNELYFHREGKRPHAPHEREDRLSFGATFTVPIRKFNLINRDSLERRWRFPLVDSWRFRSRLRVEHPFHIGETKFDWFTYGEVFYDGSARDWTRNRVAIG